MELVLVLLLVLLVDLEVREDPRAADRRPRVGVQAHRGIRIGLDPVPVEPPAQIGIVELIVIVEVRQYLLPRRHGPVHQKALPEQGGVAVQVDGPVHEHPEGQLQGFHPVARSERPGHPFALL
jgi:hypothetical protein